MCALGVRVCVPCIHTFHSFNHSIIHSVTEPSQEIRKLDSDIAVQHARTVKLSQQVEEKKRIRDETRELLKQAETQYDEVRLHVLH